MCKCWESSKEEGLSEQRGLGPCLALAEPPQRGKWQLAIRKRGRMGRGDSDLQSSPSPQAEVPDNFDDSPAPRLSLGLQGERASLIQTSMIPFHRRGWGDG